ncbi:MAG: hypothetical protein IID46_05015 [Planctomycetes bacterium]|nr:hypothetical protein [Planctomycetota bacterium]
MTDLSKSLTEFQPSTCVEILSQIEQVAVTRCPEETSAVIREGALLLAVTEDKVDAQEFPFNFLLGLPRGIEISPYLSNFFVH